MLLFVANFVRRSFLSSDDDNFYRTYFLISITTPAATFLDCNRRHYLELAVVVLQPNHSFRSSLKRTDILLCFSYKTKPNRKKKKEKKCNPTLFFVRILPSPCSWLHHHHPSSSSSFFGVNQPSKEGNHNQLEEQRKKRIQPRV